MTIDYDKIIRDLRAAGNEADAEAVEELLGRLHEAEETINQFRYEPEDRDTPEAKRRYRIAIQTYFDRRLIAR